MLTYNSIYILFTPHFIFVTFVIAYCEPCLAKDIRDAHSKDAETGEVTTPVDDILDSFEELKTADNATQAQMVMYSKLFKINFTKMDPYEFKTFTDILQRYSDLCKPLKGNGRNLFSHRKSALVPTIYVKYERTLIFY